MDNQNRSKRFSRIQINGIGGPSIIMIFAILCLTVFAILTLVYANNEYRLAEKYASATENYYKADCKAEKIFADLNFALKNGGTEELTAKAGELDAEITNENDIVYISYSVPITDVRQLNVKLLFKDSEQLQRVVWSASRSEAWSGDDGMNLLN